MFCSKCGLKSDDNAFRCTACGEELRSFQFPRVQTVNIPNYLIPSILITISCCVPLGVPAIYFALSANSKIASGDLQGAQNASKYAKLFCVLSFGVQAVFYAGFFLLIIIIFFADAISSG